MASNYEEINELLDHFDDHQYHVDLKKPVVKAFLNKLKLKLHKKSNFITSGSKFYKIGSSYENTVVNSEADFDIAMVLPHPFVMDFFESTETIYFGFYKLKCIDDSEYFNPFVNSKDFLKVEQLRNQIFAELIAVMKNISFAGYQITYDELGSAVRVSLRDYQDVLVKMDIVPQIGGNVCDGDIPGWNDDIVSPIIQTFMESSNTHVLFNLSCPPDLQFENFNHLVVQPAFSLIEKECMLKSDFVPNAVRIAKAVMKHYNWTGDGLRSFHIKQIALSMYDEIEDSDPWHGYKMIMNDLINMLEDGSVDGCFIEDQIIISKNEDECIELGQKIRTVVNKIHPNNILKQLGYT